MHEKVFSTVQKVVAINYYKIKQTNNTTKQSTKK